MEHYNKHLFIGAQIWMAIQILAPEKSKYTGEFEYTVKGMTIYCVNYGSTFAIRQIN